jgi:hypothetical protein
MPRKSKVGGRKNSNRPKLGNKETRAFLAHARSIGIDRGPLYIGWHIHETVTVGDGLPLVSDAASLLSQRLWL